MESIQIAQGVVYYIWLLFSLSFHEMSHALVAYRLGDDTASMQGRISMNPIVHMDPFGTVLFPMISIFFGIPTLGWAKPVPVHAANFRKLRQGHVLVAGAGPVSNLLLATVLTALLAFLYHTGILGRTGDLAESLVFFFQAGITLNIMLAAFNLIPVPPLDGAWVASWGLPRELGSLYDRYIEPYGFLIFFALLVTGAFRWLIMPVYVVIWTVLQRIFF